MIDVAKHQMEVSKKGAKNKLLTLTNEVKIITFPNATWDLWQEVITCAAQGDLIDVDSKELEKYKDHKNFVLDKDGVLSREFFKQLGNLFEADHVKLCRHILNRSGPSREYNHPKVVLKQPTTLRVDCYSVRDWIERRKRKATVQLQIHKIKPELGLFKNNEFDRTAWTKFKRDYHVSKASMRALLDWGIPDQYYSNQRQTMHRNTPCEDLSPYAKQFFMVFIERRSWFEPPQAAVHFRKFQVNPAISLGHWPSNKWTEYGSNAKLGIIDFRFMPGNSRKSSSTVEKPFFEEIMKVFTSQNEPALTDLPCWLFICGDDRDYLEVEAFARKSPLTGLFEHFPSKYHPAPNERLGGHAPKSKLATEPVRLLFLMKSELGITQKPKKAYLTPEHVLYEKPRKFNELQYAMYPAELRMEFYLEVLGMFCEKRDSVFLLFAGAKVVTASVVSFIAV